MTKGTPRNSTPGVTIVCEATVDFYQFLKEFWIAIQVLEFDQFKSFASVVILTSFLNVCYFCPLVLILFLPYFCKIDGSSIFIPA